MHFLTIAMKIIQTCFPSGVQRAYGRIQSSEIAKRLTKGAIWVTMGTIISRGLVLLASIFVARLLGQKRYGELGIIQSTLGMYGVFAGFGLGLTATKYIAEYREIDPERAGRIIVLSLRFAFFSGLIISGILFFSSPWLASKAINAEHLNTSLRIGTVFLLLSALNGAQTGALSGFEAFKTIAQVNSVVGLISLPTMILGTYWGGVNGAIVALTVNLAFGWAINRCALKREAARYGVPLSVKRPIKEICVLWKFSMPAALSGLLVGPINWVSTALLVNQPNGYEEMALYSAANQWRMAILFIPSMLSQVALPILSNIGSSSNNKKYSQVLVLNVLLNALLGLFAVLPLVVLAPNIMRMYGRGFSTGSAVLIFLAFSALLAAVNGVVGQAIASVGRMWLGLVFNCLWAFVLLGSTLVLLDAGYGALGLAMATFIAYLAHTCLQGIYVYRQFVYVRSMAGRHS